ncbi:peptidase [Nitrospina watsonii]|uniref:Proteasome-type protease n=1 Tax=Nitrospina watsonii TaxID=1323948 RepID=A0ABM9HG96_9BACT|nr:peptidase [Nitrospina watsonii]CAI2719256.1 conserved protein of unknown function [Nitrospina watsonii]
MTFCIGIKVAEGLVGIADSRLTSGTEHVQARKLSIHQPGGKPMFVMSSGLRSARDKVITYFDEVLEAEEENFDKLYKAVNRLASQVRKVADEDKKALEESNLAFNLHALVGGQLEKDAEPKLYMIYPQANWVEIGQGTPYHIIGNSAYGKPICDRALRYDTDLKMALKIGALAFDATRQSATDVGFPLDVVVYQAETKTMLQHSYKERDLRQVSQWWKNQIQRSLQALPSDWVEAVFTKPSSSS